MNVIYSVKDYVTNVFDFHQGTVSGAIDVVAVQHDDGSLHCSPFHVHFGKAKLKRVTDKVVQIVVNGNVVDGVHMKLGAAGEAYFVDEVDEPVEDADYTTSPISSPALPMYASVGLCSSASTSTSSLTATAAEHREKPGVHFDLPPQSAPSSRSSSMEFVANDVGDPVRWHDAYRRLVPEAPTARDDAATERLTWGWGALPTVQPAISELSNPVETDTDDELPMMVKSDSVYFDAIETESGPTYLADHPCMSLCGHLLGDAESQNDAHAIFSEHIVTFEYFRDHAVELLGDRNLMFLLDGRICPFSAELQAYFVARVLFPNSPPLSLTSLSSSSLATSGLASYQAEGEHTQQTHHYHHDTLRDNDVFAGYITDGDSYERAGCPPSGMQIDTAFVREPSPRLLSSASLSPSPNGLDGPLESSSEHFHRKTLQPSQADLLKMDLHFGTNDIEFVVPTTTTGRNSSDHELRVRARLFYWPISAKIVIAEIDGALSRIASNGMFGGLLTSKDRDTRALHHGALEFYAKLARNGYRVVYLTCRGLSQAELIHSLLRSPSSATGSGALPNGPVLLSPDRLLATSSNEVIEAREFKVAALNGIRALFPPDVNPFYAAFGRTLADSVVLTQVGVFPGKVFLVDEGDGRLRHRSMMNFQESYSSLVTMLDKMFPPLCSLSPRLAQTSSSNNGKDTASRNNGTDNGESASKSAGPLYRALASADGEDSSEYAADALAQLSETRIPHAPASMKRIYSVADDLVSEVMTSQARTRSMGDEAYNDLNFWRIRPGRV